MAEYTFFSRAHGIYTKKDHVVGYKINLKTLKELISYKCTLQPQWNQTKVQ